jgi:hypothetical protein
VIADLAARAPAGEGPVRLGALELSRHDLVAPALPLDFLPDRLAGAQVAAGGEPCEAAGPLAFRCGGARVAREVREVDGRPRPCISVRTGAAGPVEIAIPGVPVARLVRGHAGLIAGSAGAPGAPVRVALRAVGQEVDVELAGPGWRRLEIDTGRGADPVGEVEIAVASPDAGREVCVDVAALP